MPAGEDSHRKKHNTNSKSMANADGDKASGFMRNKRNVYSTKTNTRKDPEWKPVSNPKILLQTKNKRQNDQDDDDIDVDEEDDDDEDSYNDQDENEDDEDDGDDDDVDDEDEEGDDDDEDSDEDDDDKEDNEAEDDGEDEDDNEDEDEDDGEDDDEEDDDDVKYGHRRINTEGSNEDLNYFGRMKQILTGKLVDLEPER